MADEDILDEPLDEGIRNSGPPRNVPADPGSTKDSVFTPPGGFTPPPYKVGSGGLQDVDSELPEPTTRREAFLMAKVLLGANTRDRRGTYSAAEILAVADWLLGLDHEVEQERPAAPPNIFNPPTASAFEPVRRERPSGLAFLYYHPPCNTAEWRDATETLQSCKTPGCALRASRWEVLYKEKNSA